ncbi:MAG: hypothetical protein AB7O73_14995 [Bacteroidia bacterium]
MKSIIFRKLVLFSFIFLFSVFNNHAYSQRTDLPESVVISEAEYQNILSTKKGQKLKSSLPELKNAEVLLNQKVGDNIQIKLKLPNLENSELIFQINGNDSRIAFIVNDDSGIYYLTKLGSKELVLLKSNKDDIISE